MRLDGRVLLVCFWATIYLQCCPPLVSVDPHVRCRAVVAPAPGPLAEAAAVEPRLSYQPARKGRDCRLGWSGPSGASKSVGSSQSLAPQLASPASPGFPLPPPRVALCTALAHGHSRPAAPMQPSYQWRPPPAAHLLGPATCQHSTTAPGRGHSLLSLFFLPCCCDR